MSQNNNVVEMTQSQAEMQAELQRLREENAKLKATKSSNGMKVTEKGAVSVYGLGRFPVTLYKSQWVSLLARVEEIKAFIEANQDKLTDKAKQEEVKIA